MIVIVDSHHKALSAWAKYRSSLSIAPRLITLDHHTDTSKPFRNYIHTNFGKDYEFAEDLRLKWISEVDFNNSASVDLAIAKLSNDEHIITAIKTGILSAALVVAHNAANTDLETYREHNVICRSVNLSVNSNKATRLECDLVLESNFLNKIIDDFNKVLLSANEIQLHGHPYILDIDLDYLNTFKSVQPDDPTTLRQLVNGAGLITVATEPEYVQTCALDNGLTSENLLKQLLTLIS